MIEPENLKYFINEEIFLVKDIKRSVTSNEMEPPTIEKVSEEKIEYSKEVHDLMVWTEKLADQDYELLKKMLGAIKLDPESIHLIQEESHFTPQFKVLLCFGNASLLSSRLNQQIPLNKLISMDGKKILASYPLAQLHGDVEKKTALWNSLKALFLA